MIAHEQCLQPEVQQPLHVLLSPTVFKVNVGHGSGQFSRSVVSNSCHGYTCFIIIFLISLSFLDFYDEFLSFRSNHSHVESLTIFFGLHFSSHSLYTGIH